MRHLVFRSLSFYRRMHLGVGAGVVLATAVLTGALVIGDSVDYSLRRFAALRLGDIHYALQTRNQFFRQPLGDSLRVQTDANVALALQVPGMALRPGGEPGSVTQVNRVEVLGIDTPFWSFAEGEAIHLAPNATAINEKLATALGVVEGDEISLRMFKPTLMARDAPLAWRGDATSKRARLVVARVLPDEQLGRFSLFPSQIAPYNAFVDLAWLQDQVELPDRANLLLVGDGVSQEALDRAMRSSWQLEHIGLRVRSDASGILQLETDRVFLRPETVRVALRVPGARGTLAYLVNSISKGDRLTPYSFMVGGPVPSELRNDEIVINRWLADHLDARVGDDVAVAYYELLANSSFAERKRDFTVHSVREMNDLAAERSLMPTFPGLSDVERCADWDVGMPMDEALLSDEANETYWETYRQTPKAFVTLRAGQEMWGNRFGDLTAVRFPADAGPPDDLMRALHQDIDPTQVGLFFIPVSAQAQNAVSRAMNFGGLFLGMSFFLIVSALLLTGLLFVFGVQQRAAELGTLLALGFRPGQVRALLLGEGLVVSLLGSLAGGVLGIAYTRALLYGLARHWQGAVAGAAIRFHAEYTTLLLGMTIGLVVSMAALALAVWRLAKYPARDLLSMNFTQELRASKAPRFRRLGLYASLLGVVLSLSIIVFARFASAADPAAAFFAAGALMLLAGIGLFRHVLIALRAGASSSPMTLPRLALQNAARRQTRSLTVVGLLACGCFLVLAVSSMQEDLRAHARQRSSGTGGFSLIADATFPVLDDPFEATAEPGFTGTGIKVRDGDDASCLNLNQAQSPRILGVNTAAFVERGAFVRGDDADTLWQLLDAQRDDGAVPALVGDKNTAMWTLKKKVGPERGDVLNYRDESGKEVAVKLVGALPTRLSVFQGAILISDQAFTKLFPSEDGHRMFLIDAPPGAEARVAGDLQRAYDRFGLDVVPAVDRLLEFYAVETTYLGMFLVLGGLGLALGGVGMGVVVLRNLLERRGELATLRALGYRPASVYRLLFSEYGLLLAVGLGVGAAAAVVAMLPALTAADSNVAVDVQLRIALLVIGTAAICMVAAVVGGFRKHDPDALRNE